MGGDILLSLEDSPFTADILHEVEAQLPTLQLITNGLQIATYFKKVEKYHNPGCQSGICLTLVPYHFFLYRFHM